MVRATSYNNKIMKILVTGAKGFVGKNLCAQLNNIKDGKARCYGELKISDVFEYDLQFTITTSLTVLDVIDRKSVV